MLKKISVEQLKVGMYLKEFCGSWMEHPFWRSGFVISDPKDIQAVLASSIKEVWIDMRPLSLRKQMAEAEYSQKGSDRAPS